MADDAISLQASLSPASSALAMDQDQASHASDASDGDFTFPSDDDKPAPLPSLSDVDRPGGCDLNEPQQPPHLAGSESDGSEDPQV